MLTNTKENLSFPTPNDNSGPVECVASQSESNRQYTHQIHLLKVANELSDSIAEMTELEPALKLVAYAIKSEVGFGTCVSLIEEMEGNLQVWVDSDRKESRYCYVLPDNAIERTVLDTGRGIAVNPLELPLNVSLLPLQNYPLLIIIPINHNHKELGILYAFSQQQTSLPSYIFEFLEQIARRIGIATANWYGLQESRYKTKKLKVLHTIMSEAVNRDNDINRVIQIAAEEIAQSMDVSRVIMGLLNEERQMIEIVSATAEYPNNWAESLDCRFPGGDTRHMEAFFTGKPVVVRDGMRDSRCSHFAKEMGLYSSITVPIMYKGKRIGIIYADNSDYRTYPDMQVEFLNVVANQLGLAVTNNRQFEHIKMLAVTDGLTGLHTRQYFNERYMDEYRLSARHNFSLCLIMIDVDDFKKINDTYGHIAGDNVLVSVARMIKKQVRISDVVARYGGEEIIILLPQTGLAQGKVIAERIRKGFHKLPYSFSITASIGVAALPEQSVEPEELLMLADDAMYRAKNEGKDQIRIGLKKIK
ncbi:diguanylate cyclase [Aneurinibacillus sp. Ricciae_BoGa-3]|uniref:sensor domain-containing diguanylate cyclase n=1 Tax=Aneurinibacillus sp. Ricciae_BoGa-3 TaxID=3022697 RepID=UPI00233FB657|nr:diguanylate cyclase [Aneurinibacillus sp. Ricciae_BoGa-3]WCK53107.1 diguanylate cyclase [Aneurinibacillus sp. Ricciae_BoGa-3]